MIRSRRRGPLILAVSLAFLLNPATRVCAERPDEYAPYDDGIPAGWELIEGDILVPVISLLGTFETRFWPGGVVPYEFDTNVTETNQRLMLGAMAEWEAVANISFVPWTRGYSNYIHIQDAAMNSSVVGMKMGTGDQVMNIYNWNLKFIMVHELGHALGFWHEQSRLDRDEYITINWGRIISICGADGDENCGYNFDKHLDASVYGPYDFDSVVHYSAFSFSSCSGADRQAYPESCRTITVRPPWDDAWQNYIGQRSHLSDLDALTMSFLYPGDDWVFVNGSYELAPACATRSKTGTFLSPYCDFETAARLVPPGGTVILQPGVYYAVGTYTNAMTLRAPLGEVVLGE